jgi:pyruvate/2-oxoglutarate dehydrogenase complex dihydrolipoamide dehydrogenase (E3) component
MRTASLHHVDEDLRQYVVDGMRKRGMEIMEGCEPVAINGNGSVQQVVVRDSAGVERALPCDFVFVGTGERPKSDHYRNVLGVAVGERGNIIVDKHMRTSVPNVYAIGDLIGPPMEMFKARKGGVTAARNIMGEPTEFDWTDYPDFLHSTYEVTWVGMTEDEARALRRYHDHPDAAQGRAVWRYPAALRRGHHAIRLPVPRALGLPEGGDRQRHAASAGLPPCRLWSQRCLPVSRPPDAPARRDHDR